MSDLFEHRLRVRLGECDPQGVVFNANYLAYVDDAVDVWLRERLGAAYPAEFDIMLKKATIEWTAPARPGDVITMRVRVSRWGRTSFDVGIDGSVGEQPAFAAEILYISVKPGTVEPVPPSNAVKAALAG